MQCIYISVLMVIATLSGWSRNISPKNALLFTMPLVMLSDSPHDSVVRLSWLCSTARAAVVLMTLDFLMQIISSL